MHEIRLFRGTPGREVGTVALAGGSLEVRVADEALAAKVRDFALKPLPYLRDEAIPGGEKTVKAVAQPGTEEHLRVLMFEVRKLGLEARAAVEQELPRGG